MKKPKIGDKVKITSKLYGNKLSTIDSLTGDKIHFTNGLTVNYNRVNYISKSWRGTNFEYISIN